MSVIEYLIHKQHLNTDTEFSYVVGPGSLLNCGGLSLDESLLIDIQLDVGDCDL